MKLQEIISTKLGKPEPAQDASELPQPDPESQSDPEDRPLGHGSYALVLPDPSDPHMVIRKEYKFTEPRTNGYFRWARRIRKEAEHNPYLPRIYEISQEVDPGNSKQRRFTYKLERLHGGYELSPQQILSLARNTMKNFDVHLLRDLDFQDYVKQYARTLAQFHPDDPSKIYPLKDKAKIIELGRKVLDEISQGEIDASNNELPWIIWSVFVYGLEDALLTGRAQLVSSRKLTQAYSLVQELKPLHGLTDIAPENIMVRLHPPQIVITDPLASER